MAGETIIGVASPRNPVQGQRMREHMLAVVPDLPPFPMVYKDGVAWPCPDCGVVLSIGPRMASRPDIVVLCPLCAARHGATMGGSFE